MMAATSGDSSRDLFNELMSSLDAERKALAEERAKINEERSLLEELRRNILAIVNPLPEDGFVLSLSVGGHPFEVKAGTLRRYPTSLLAGLCAQVIANPDPRSAMPLFIDRNPALFHIVCVFFSLFFLCVMIAF